MLARLMQSDRSWYNRASVELVLFCSEAAGRAADAAVQIHGAMGVSQDFGVERLFRDARSYRILDGTSDIQRGMIASRVQKSGLGDALAPGGLA